VFDLFTAEIGLLGAGAHQASDRRRERAGLVLDATTAMSAAMLDAFTSSIGSIRISLAGCITLAGVLGRLYHYRGLRTFPTQSYIPRFFECLQQL
jgi:hypothetical protein